MDEKHISRSSSSSSSSSSEEIDRGASAHKKSRSSSGSCPAYTLTRNKVGYLRNLGLAHIKLEVTKANAKQDHGMSWSELLKQYDSLNEVTDEDEENIAWTIVLLYGDEDNDEQPGQTVTGGPASAETDEHSTAALQLPAAVNSNTPPPTEEEVGNIRRSRSGRTLRAKVDNLFVRMDDDGGLPR